MSSPLSSYFSASHAEPPCNNDDNSDNARNLQRITCDLSLTFAVLSSVRSVTGEGSAMSLKPFVVGVDAVTEIDVASGDLETCRYITDLIKRSV